jgi:hypothetical protein
MRPLHYAARLSPKKPEEATMNILWIIVACIFALATLGAVTLGLISLFGGGPRPQH